MATRIRSAVRVLRSGLWATATDTWRTLVRGEDPVLRSVASAPVDDEPDDDDFDGGLTEARGQAARGETISHEEVKRRLGVR